MFSGDISDDNNQNFHLIYSMHVLFPTKISLIIVLYLNITNILSLILTARLTTTIESLLSSTGHFSHDRERTQVRQNVCWKKEKDRIKIQLKRNLKINNLDNQNILLIHYWAMILVKLELWIWQPAYVHYANWFMCLW